MFQGPAPWMNLKMVSDKFKTYNHIHYVPQKFSTLPGNANESFMLSFQTFNPFVAFSISFGEHCYIDQKILLNIKNIFLRVKVHGMYFFIFVSGNINVGFVIMRVWLFK